MKIVGQILLACILVAALHSVITAALVAFFLLLLWGALFRPKRTFAMVFALLLLGLAAEQPRVFILVAGAVIVLLAIIRHREPQSRRKRSRPTTLPLALPAPPGGAVWRAGGHDEAGDG